MSNPPTDPNASPVIDEEALARGRAKLAALMVNPPGGPRPAEPQRVFLVAAAMSFGDIFVLMGKVIVASAIWSLLLWLLYFAVFSKLLG